jgi:hypothetical protein
MDKGLQPLVCAMPYTDGSLLNWISVHFQSTILERVKTQYILPQTRDETLLARAPARQRDRQVSARPAKNQRVRPYRGSASQRAQADWLTRLKRPARDSCTHLDQARGCAHRIG